MPESIEEHVKKAEATKVQELRKGTKVQNLNKPEFPDRDKNIAFDRFTNRGEAMIKSALQQNRAKIEQRQTKKDYEPDIPFKN